MDHSFTLKSKYLAPELWDIIATYCDRSTLHRLTLAHKGLTGPIQRRLFRKQSFRLYIQDRYDQIRRYSEWSDFNLECFNENDLAHNLRRFEGLTTSHIASWIRSWDFQGALPFFKDEDLGAESLEAFHTPALESFLPSLVKYPYLTSLRLGRIQINEPELAIIGSLENLKKLAFYRVEFHCQMFLPKPLLLEEFTFEDESAECTQYPELTPVSIYSPGHLKILSLDCIWTDALSSYVLRDGSEYTNLVELKIPVKPQTAVFFMKFLERCPILERLTVIKAPAFDVNYYDPMIVPTPNACPRLRELTCPPGLAGKLIQGRPVWKLVVNYDDSAYKFYPLDVINHMMTTISRTPNVIRELHLHRMPTAHGFKLLPTIRPILSQLRVLRVEILDIEEDDPRFRQPLAHEPEDMDEMYPMEYAEEGRSAGQCDDDDDTIHELFGSCFDPPDPNIPSHMYLLPPTPSTLEIPYKHGYPNLLAHVALGSIILPDGLFDLQLILSRLFHNGNSDSRFTSSHEAGILHAVARNSQLSSTLRRLTIGIEHTYNPSWELTTGPPLRWIKPDVFSEDGTYVTEMTVPPTTPQALV